MSNKNSNLRVKSTSWNNNCKLRNRIIHQVRMMNRSWKNQWREINNCLKTAYVEQEFELASKINELEQQLQAAQQNHASSENDESFLEELVEKNQPLQKQLQAAQ
jgi:hypothetical protein